VRGGAGKIRAIGIWSDLIGITTLIGETILRTGAAVRGQARTPFYMYRFLYQKGLVEVGFPWNSLDPKKDGTPSFSMSYKPPWNTMETRQAYHCIIGAGSETRTRDLNLGNIVLPIAPSDGRPPVPWGVSGTCGRVRGQRFISR
jgi:hypothetical protein